jgi:hypothetical protein
MIREIWDNFTAAPIVIAGGGNAALAGGSDTEEAYDGFDLIFEFNREGNFDGLITVVDFDTGVPTVRHIVISGRGSSNRYRYTFVRPIKNIDVAGLFTNDNAANANTVGLNINTFKLQKIRR